LQVDGMAAPTNVTKADMMVLFQIDAGVTDPEDIADIVGGVRADEVKAAMHQLRELGLIRTEKKQMLVTEKGKEALQTHHKWALGL